MIPVSLQAHAPHRARPPEKAACARVTPGQHRAAHGRSEAGRSRRGRASGPQPSTTELLAIPCSHPVHHPPGDAHACLPRGGATKKSPADIAKCPLWAKCAPSLRSAPQILATHSHFGEKWGSGVTKCKIPPNPEDILFPKDRCGPQRAYRPDPGEHALTPGARAEDSS